MHNDQLAITLETIRSLEARYQRPEGSVRLLAVSKKKPLSDIKIAYEQGQREFGENYLQEALEKIRPCSYSELNWHFIGPIQSNKTQAIAEHFQWVHSLDRIKIAGRLNQARNQHAEPLNICIQLNISQEASKSGISVPQLHEFASQLEQYQHLKLRGIMALPKPVKEFDRQREQFREVYEAYQTLQTEFKTVDTLSMGTSQDMAAAIAEGSTMVRIGTALFGQR